MRITRTTLPRSRRGFLYQTLRELLVKLETLEREQVASVRQRLEWAYKIEKLSIDDHRDRWQEARRAILRADGKVASELYREPAFELPPQMGLVPIGMNPANKLWEFYNLRSAWDPEKGIDAAGGIEIPEHREDGSIEVTEDTGIVFVLIPGGKLWMGAQKDDPNGQNYDPVVSEKWNERDRERGTGSTSELDRACRNLRTTFADFGADPGRRCAGRFGGQSPLPVSTFTQPTDGST